MAKKGPIGKVEGFYIENHYMSVDASQLAKDLDRPKASIENYIKKYVKAAPKTTPKIGDHFARRPGVVTMTENASSMSDSRRKNRPISTKCVVKIKDE
jgi:plasmid maintenance system antidote protein VapI